MSSHPSLPMLRETARSCRACDLWERGTQTVLGEGNPSARIVLVGEQPGNDEDLAGKPFVGPAGRILDEALNQAGIDRRQTYVTNVVKRFKWEPRGKRRIHSKPNAAEIRACSQWLTGELEAIQPKVIVCLGATAAKALLGESFRVTIDRGKPIASNLAPFVLATVHPSSILRAPDDETRRLAIRQFVDDLTVVEQALRMVR